MVKVNNKPVTIGSRWWAGNDKRFVVTNVIEDTSNNIWVHYTDDKVKDGREYNCYIAAFLDRFTGLPE
jgi:hypothetical protein